MPRPKKIEPGQPRLTKRERALLDALVVLHQLRADGGETLGGLIEKGLAEFEYEGPGIPTVAGIAASQVENVEPEGRNYKEDAAELAGAVIAFVNALDTVTNDQAFLLQFAKDVLAGKVE